jgi:hypothetical protein
MSAQPQLNRQNAEIDFRELVAAYEESEHPSPSETSAGEWELVQRRIQKSKPPRLYSPSGIGLSEWANILLAALTSLGGFLSALLFFNTPEHFRPGKPWPREFLYPRPSVVSNETDSPRSAQTPPSARNSTATGSSNPSGAAQRTDQNLNSSPYINPNHVFPPLNNPTAANSTRGTSAGPNVSTSQGKGGVSEKRRRRIQIKKAGRHEGKVATERQRSYVKQNSNRISHATGSRQNQVSIVHGAHDVNRQSIGAVRGLDMHPGGPFHSMETHMSGGPSAGRLGGRSGGHSGGHR